jgi:hypothetical protein
MDGDAGVWGEWAIALLGAPLLTGLRMCAGFCAGYAVNGGWRRAILTGGGGGEWRRYGSVSASKVWASTGSVGSVTAIEVLNGQSDKPCLYVCVMC